MNVNFLENSPEQDVILTDLQQLVGNKLTATTNQVVQEVLGIIKQSAAMSPQNFIATHVTPRQEALSHINERTKKFFQEMMKAINEELDKVEESGKISLAQSFQILAFFTGDLEIRTKFVEGVALPLIKNLMTDLDNIDPSIINQINMPTIVDEIEDCTKITELFNKTSHLV